MAIFGGRESSVRGDRGLQPDHSTVSNGFAIVACSRPVQTPASSADQTDRQTGYLFLNAKLTPLPATYTETGAPAVRLARAASTGFVPGASSTGECVD